MRGINTFEDTVKNPSKDIIDWEYIMMHPEVKSDIVRMYKYNSLFAMKINEKIETNELFRLRFFKYFSSYFASEKQEVKVR